MKQKHPDRGVFVFNSRTCRVKGFYFGCNAKPWTDSVFEKLYE
jgi:hypothetical protein